MATTTTRTATAGDAATFTVTRLISGNQVTLTLGACTPANNCGDLNTVNGNPTLGLVFAPAVVGVDTLTPQLPTAPLAALLF